MSVGEAEFWFEPIVVLLVLLLAWSRRPWLGVFLTGASTLYYMGPSGEDWTYDLLYLSPLLLGTVCLAYWYRGMPRLRLGFWESLVLGPSYMLAAVLWAFLLHYWMIGIPLSLAPLILFCKYGWVDAEEGGLAAALGSAILTVLIILAIMWIALMSTIGAGF